MAARTARRTMACSRRPSAAADTGVGRTQGLLPTLPVVRSALEMRDCHDHDFGSSEMVNDLVREGPHQHPPGRSTGANRRADLRAFCNQRHRGGDSVEELGSKSASTLLVPVNRFGELFRGGLDTAELTRHRPRISLSMRRFTSSQGSSRAVPDSIAATRRWISVAHAASASGSAGPSRLASISAASSARASTSSRRASARTASAALVMAVILPCVSPPNKRVNLTVRSVTCPAMAAGRAPARPAGYAQRYVSGKSQELTAEGHRAAARLQPSADI